MLLSPCFTSLFQTEMISAHQTVTDNIQEPNHGPILCFLPSVLVLKDFKETELEVRMPESFLTDRLLEL